AATAVQLLFGFTLAAGVLGLAAGVHATREERMHEVAVMRGLGAGAGLLRAAPFRAPLRRGVVAGPLGGGAALGWSWVRARHVLEVELVSVWWPWPAGLVAGMLAALRAGHFALSGVLRASPLSTLREVT